MYVIIVAYYYNDSNIQVLTTYKYWFDSDVGNN